MSARGDERVAELFRLDENHRLDAVAVRIADKGSVIILMILGAETRNAVTGAAAGEGGGMKGIDRRG